MLKNISRICCSLPLVVKNVSNSYSTYCSLILYKKTFHKNYHLFSNINKTLIARYSTNGQKASDNEQNCNSYPENDKLKILEMAMNHVNEYGWSHKAITKGAEDAGIVEITEGMFENEGADLVMYFVKLCNQKLVSYLQENVEKQKESGEKLNVNLFVRDAIEFRLRLIIPYINVWAEALQLLLHPKVLNQSTDELSKMVDDIWVYTGDKSSGPEWYAKRGFLAQLYGGLQLVMLTDQSVDYKDTWKFLDLRSVWFDSKSVRYHKTSNLAPPCLFKKSL